MPRIHVDRPPTYTVPPDDVAELAPAAPAPASVSQPAAKVDRDVPAPDKAEDYSVRTVAELRELLRSRDLRVSGDKADLIERLEADDEAGTKAE